MEAELKQKWVAALRSGEYIQTQNILFEDGAYCCLGVLCKVANIEINRNGTAINGDFSGSRYDKLNPFITDVHKSTLIQMNDCENKSFPEIADYIEQNL